jgi:hypothetical protein
MVIKGAIHQEEITVINLYASNVSAPNFIKHTLKDLKSYIDYNTAVVGDFNTLVSPIDKSSRQKVNKKSPAGYCCLTPVILATQEAEIRKITV